MNMAFSALSLLAGLSLFLSWHLQPLHYLIFFLSVWWVYVFDVFASSNLEDSLSHIDRGFFLRKHCLLFQLISYFMPLVILVLFVLKKMPLELWVISAVSLVLAIAYSRGIFSMRIKSLGYNKTFIVTMAWSVGTFLYAYFISQAEMSFKAFGLFTLIFLLLLLDTYFLDYQDLSADKGFGIHSLAANKKLNSAFFSVHNYLAQAGEAKASLLMSSWRYLFLLVAVTLHFEYFI